MKAQLSRIRRWFTGRQHGQSLVLVALALFAMMGVSGLAIDTALVMSARRELVAVTDGAALAAAGALAANPTESDTVRQQHATERARQYAVLNGFDANAPDHILTVSFPTTDPPSRRAQVQASRRVDLTFMRIFGLDSLNVSSGSRVAEAAPLDIVIVQDVSDSQRTNTHCNEDGGYIIRPSWTGSRVDCSGIPSNYKAGPGYEYRPNEATTALSSSPWPPSKYPPNRPNVPWDPFAREQWAARFFIDQLDPRYDHVGLVSFSSRDSSYHYDAVIQSPLTTNYEMVKNKIGYSPQTPGQTGIPGLYPDGYTNMAAGIQIGMQALLDEDHARENAVAAMILLSDGSATRRLNGSTPSGCSSRRPENCGPARKDVMDVTREAMSKGIVIYTIYVGTDEFEQDDGLMMEWIADLTDNQHLDGDYSGSRALPNGYGPVIYPPPSENYYRAYTQEELQATYELILEKVYTRLVQ